MIMIRIANDWDYHFVQSVCNRRLFLTESKNLFFLEKIIINISVFYLARKLFAFDQSIDAKRDLDSLVWELLGEITE
jgi:hypothetical protein